MYISMTIFTRPRSCYVLWGHTGKAGVGGGGVACRDVGFFAGGGAGLREEGGAGGGRGGGVAE